MTPEDLIAERAKTHGDYDRMAKAHTALLQAYAEYSSVKLTGAQFFALNMIFVKIARVLTGDPNFRDHWDDIAGYAKLAADRCKPPKPVNGADTLGLNKPSCHCGSEECIAERGGAPKYVYCKKAENAVYD